MASRAPGDLEGGADAAAHWKRESARLAFEWDTDDGKDARALAMFEEARALRPRLGIRGQVALEYGTMLWNLGQFSRIKNDPVVLAGHRPLERDLLVADLLGVEHGVDSRPWLDHVNALMGRRWGTAPLEFRAGDADPFDRLAAPSARAVPDGPLITVIMTTHRRGREIFTAVRSILEQTWANVELLIVDDASGPEFAASLDEVEALDDRISVIRLDDNVGAYRARNVALARARGTYVTMQDDDDWSHPERLERHARVLEEDPDVCSVRSQCARASDSMVFRYRGSAVLVANGQSEMFRRADLDRVGYFDATRKGGDTEHVRRVEQMTGGVHVELPDVLEFLRLTDGSLSRTEFAVGWRHPVRSEYREAWTYYHSLLAQGRARVPGPGPEREFPAPRRFQTPQQLEQRASEYDLLLARDWRYADRGDEISTALLHRAVAAGERVGVVHCADPRRPGQWSTPVDSSIRQLIHEGVVDRVLTTEEISARTLLVEDPAVLEVAEREPWSPQVETVVLVPVDEPAAPGHVAAWSLESTLRYATEVVGATEVRWLGDQDEARSARLRAGAILEASGNGADTPGRLPRPLLDPLAPIVGRLVSPVLAGPLSADAADVLPALPEGADVRVLTDPHVHHRWEPVDPAWMVYRTGDLPFAAFVAQLDFYVMTAAVSPGVGDLAAALRAAAVGRVVLARPELRDHLGDAALYVTDGELASTMRGLSADREAYRAQVSRAQAAVQTMTADLDLLAAISTGGTSTRWREASDE